SSRTSPGSGPPAAAPRCARCRSTIVRPRVRATPRRSRSRARTPRSPTRPRCGPAPTGPGRTPPRSSRPVGAEATVGPGSVVEVEVDAGQPEARGVDLVRGGEVLLALPQAAQPLLARPLEHAGHERAAAVVGGLGELQPEEALDEAVAVRRLDAAPAEGLGQHPVAADEPPADLVEHVVDHADHDRHEGLELAL